MEVLDFSTLFQRHGGYSLIVLIELRHPEKSPWYFTNAKDNITYLGVEFLAVPMGYTPPSSNDGIFSGGTLEISIDVEKGEVSNRQLLLAWFDTADDRIYLRVRVLINKDGTISEIGLLRHQYGTVTWDGEKIIWNLGEDPRLQMQVNPVIFEPDTLID